MKRLVIFTLALATVLALGMVSANASTSVFPPSGVHGITPQGGGDVWKFGDSNGDGSVSVNYSASPYRVYLLYQLSNFSISICEPNTLNETLDLYNGSKRVLHDNHPVAACNYNHHPTYQQGRASGYQMRVHDIFKVKISGHTGTATLDAQANFDITLV